MKKKLSLILSGILCVGLLTGCTQATNSGFAGTYWLQNPIYKQVEENFYERIEYTVTTEAEYEGNEIDTMDNSENLYFAIDANKSSYVTELYSENGLYVYKTALTLYGEYVFAGESVVIEGAFTETETTFKSMEDGFACVKSVKKIKNTFPTNSNPLSADEFKTVDVTITTEYGEKNATHTLSGDEVSKSYFSSLKEPVTVKKYNKKAYIENDLMLLMARNFSYESSLNYTFYTIESATGELTQIQIAPDSKATNADESDSQTTAFKTLSVNCQIDDVIRKVDFNTFRIKFSTTGEYAQDFTYAYYANTLDSDTKDEHNLSRHYMVKCYRPALYNTYYMVFTLDKVSHEKPSI